MKYFCCLNLGLMQTLKAFEKLKTKGNVVILFREQNRMIK